MFSPLLNHKLMFDTKNSCFSPVALRTHRFWKPQLRTLLQGPCEGFQHPTGAPFSLLWIEYTVNARNISTRDSWNMSRSNFLSRNKEISGISSKINGSASITQRSTLPSGMTPVLDQNLNTECLLSVIASQKCFCSVKTETWSVAFRAKSHCLAHVYGKRKNIFPSCYFWNVWTLKTKQAGRKKTSVLQGRGGS